MNSNLNILTIIRALYSIENIHLFLERGKQLGFKFYPYNSHKKNSSELNENSLKEIIEIQIKNSKIELLTNTQELNFILTFESKYSSKANQTGLECNFKEITSIKNEPDKVASIKLMLSLIDNYFIYEFHAQKGEYLPEED